MEFFNKKEEVLDVQLTEYGKYLLSQGRLKPAFYAFYDDEILYDIAANGRTEKQKDADRRIRYETPNLKAQTNTTGVETRVKQFVKNIRAKLNELAPSANSIDFTNVYASVPQFDQKFFVATDPLGTSDLKSDFDAAWGIVMRHNKIAASQDYYTVNLTSSAATANNGVIKEIPQIDITMDYQLFYTTETSFAATDDFEILAPVNDTINLALRKDHISIDLHEFNTASEKDNFYLEVFLSGSGVTLEQICKDPDRDPECEDRGDCPPPPPCWDDWFCTDLECIPGDPLCPDDDTGDDIPCPDCGELPDPDRTPPFDKPCNTCGVGPECEDC